MNYIECLHRHAWDVYTEGKWGHVTSGVTSQRPYEAAKNHFKMHLRMRKQNYIPVTNAMTNPC